MGTTKSREFKVAGTYSFSVPATVSSVLVSMISGGDSGCSETLGSGGGGGGSGQYCLRHPYKVTPGGTETVVVGSGGAAVGGANLGLHGTFSSFGMLNVVPGIDNNPNRTTGRNGASVGVISLGGPSSGGSFGSFAVGAGIRRGGTNFTDGAGGGGGATGSSFNAMDGAGAAGWVGGLQGAQVGSGGGGGSSPWGQGGAGGQFSFGKAGSAPAASAYGAGGGGTSRSVTVETSGAGMHGYVLVEWIE